MSKTTEDKLKALADALKRNSEVSLDIIGHADSVGDEQKNMKLSHKRSLAVKSFLVKEGVEQDRLNALSKGDTQPISKNQEKNRRAEFKGLVEFKVR
ncbi:MAG: OmpA family protein [Epsilonproteobacteria bacterium]|nr:OmpA family protein [Campylobacterota bacterium]